MSTLLEFMKEAEVNEELQESFRSVSTLEDVRQLAASHGYELTDEDLHDLSEAAKTIDTSDMELSDEQLEQVAGGAFFTTLLAVGGLVAVTGAVVYYFGGGAKEKGKQIVNRRQRQIEEASRRK